MKPAVRAATLQDADAVAQVLCESRRVFVAHAPMAHAPEQVRDWAAQVLIPGGGVWVATRGREVVGMLAVSGSVSERCVEHLYVKPGHTGQGIGAMLLQTAHQLLVPPIRLHTFQASGDARRFYERHGYVVVCCTDGSGNEERCPDVLYEWRGTAVSSSPSS